MGIRPKSSETDEQVKEVGSKNSNRLQRVEKLIDANRWAELTSIFDAEKHKDFFVKSTAIRLYERLSQTYFSMLDAEWKALHNCDIDYEIDLPKLDELMFRYELVYANDTIALKPRTFEDSRERVTEVLAKNIEDFLFSKEEHFTKCNKFFWYSLAVWAIEALDRELGGAIDAISEAEYDRRFNAHLHRVYASDVLRDYACETYCEISSQTFFSDSFIEAKGVNLLAQMLSGGVRKAAPKRRSARGFAPRGQAKRSNKASRKRD